MSPILQAPRTAPGIDTQMAAAMLKSRARVPEGHLDATAAPIGDAVRAYLAT